MDAMLSDTVGTQINNKRSKGGNFISTLPGPLAKIAAKPQIPQSSTIIRLNSDFVTTDSVDSVGQVASSSHMNTISNKDSSIPTITSVATANISSGINAPELKSLIVLNGDIVTTTIPATFASSPPFVSSSYFADSASPSPSLGTANNTDLNSSRYLSRKAPPFASGVVPFRLSSAQLNNNQNLLGTSSSFPPPTSSSLTSSISTSFPATTLTAIAGQSQKGHEEQSSATLLQEILKRQEQLAYPDRVARRRVEAREKRRERREVRMTESLGRIATALELLSSKQDTVIALLQRLADRK